MHISVSNVIHISNFSPPQRDAILAADPHAVLSADDHLITLGRAALGPLSSLPCIASAQITDNRTYDPRAEIISAPFLPKHYDLNTAIAASCGIFFLSAQCWRTGLPNLVRNLAALSGQRPVVLSPSPAIISPFFQSPHYLPPHNNQSTAMPQCLFASEPPLSAGLLIAAVNTSATPNFFSAFCASPAAYRFAVLTPSRQHYSLAAELYPHLGSTVYNNAKFAATDVVPVNSPFAHPVRGPRSRFYAVNQRETAFVIATNRQRNALIADLIQRTASLRNLIVVTVISHAHAIVPAISHLHPLVLPPQRYSSTSARLQIIAAANEGPCTLIATASDLAAFAARIKPCDRAYILAPTPVKTAAAALAPVRANDPASFTPSHVRRVYLIVDNDPDLANRQFAIAHYLAKQPLTLVTAPDSRYLS